MYGGMGYGGIGGMGGMGGMYGGGYGSYGGMGGMYGGMPGYGMPGGAYGADPMQPTLTQTLEGATQNTFTLLHSIVQTFGGVAQMLESTFMATHSSFFAMVGVVDQIGQLRAALGSVLGLFGLVRWLRDLLTGRRPGSAMQGEFRDFVSGRPVQPQGQPAPRTSKKPLIIFLLAVLGIPYAMHRLVRALVARQQALAEQQQGALPPLDPSQLTFARALYPFEPSSPAELAMKENEIVAIMGKLDPATGAEIDPRFEVRCLILTCAIISDVLLRWKGASGGKGAHAMGGKDGFQKSGSKCWKDGNPSSLLPQPQPWRQKRQNERAGPFASFICASWIYLSTQSSVALGLPVFASFHNFCCIGTHTIIHMFVLHAFVSLILDGTSTSR